MDRGIGRWIRREIEGGIEIMIQRGIEGEIEIMIQRGIEGGQAKREGKDRRKD